MVKEFETQLAGGEGGAKEGHGSVGGLGPARRANELTNISGIVGEVIPMNAEQDIHGDASLILTAGFSGIDMLSGGQVVLFRVSAFLWLRKRCFLCVLVDRTEILLVGD